MNKMNTHHVIVFTFLAVLAVGYANPSAHEGVKRYTGCKENEYVADLFTVGDIVLCKPCAEGEYMDEPLHTNIMCKDCAPREGTTPNPLCNRNTTTTTTAKPWQDFYIVIWFVPAIILALILVVVGSLVCCYLPMMDSVERFLGNSKSPTPRASRNPVNTTPRANIIYKKSLPQTRVHVTVTKKITMYEWLKQKMSHYLYGPRKPTQQNIAFLRV